MSAVRKIGLRIAVGALALSAAGFSTWTSHEGFTSKAVIPTKGDVPTLGHGSTHYGDGRKVQMGDTITRAEAATLARKLITADEKQMAASLPGVAMTQSEWDAYVDFTGQYGVGNFKGSAMRRELLAGRPVQACKALLRYKFAAGYDCSTMIGGKPNKRCYGVWTRQVERSAKCGAEL